MRDPADPTPSMPDLGVWPLDEQPLDRRWRLRRDDVLVYTGAPLGHDLEIIGHPTLVLHAASDCPDTDWHVTLCEVLPDGRSEQLASGCLRAAYRAGVRTPPAPIAPGEAYQYTIELSATANVWRRGHRLRVTIASADFPTYARNPNTAAPPGDDREWRVARNTVHHSAAHPSRLLAPVAAD
jgi:hypothetical protein